MGLCVQIIGDVITVSGELDIATIADLDQAAAIVEDPLVVDLAGISFIDAAGIGALIRLNGRRQLVLDRPSGPVRRLFSLVALDGVFAIRERDG